MWQVVFENGEQQGRQQPVTYVEPGFASSKNAWWRQQLQAALEDDARLEMLAAMHVQSPTCANCSNQQFLPVHEYSGPILSFQQLQAF